MVEHPQTKAQEINQVLYDISQAINETVQLDDLFQIIHQSLGQIIDVTNFFIVQYNSAENTIRFPYHVDSRDSHIKDIPYQMDSIKG